MLNIIPTMFFICIYMKQHLQSLCTHPCAPDHGDKQLVAWRVAHFEAFGIVGGIV